MAKYDFGGAVTALALVNPPGAPALQLNQVTAQSLSGVARTFGEYCVFLDVLETRQTRPGVGEARRSSAEHLIATKALRCHNYGLDAHCRWEYSAIF